MIPIFKAKRINGQRLLKFQTEERFKEYLQSFKEGTILDVLVRKALKRRSLPQNRYYWKVIVGEIAKDTGQDKKTVHDGLRDLFLSHVDERTGFKIRESTTVQSTEKFRKYCDKCQRWAADFLNIYIPDPSGSEIDWSSNEYDE